MITDRAFGVLKVAQIEVALDGLALEQVVNWPAHLQRHPLTGGALLGLFSLRGKALPLIDLRHLLGADHDEPRAAKVAIVNHEGGRFGLAIDGVSDVVKIDAQQICRLQQPHASPALLPELALLGEERMVYLLDLAALAALPEVLMAQVRPTAALAPTQQANYALRHLFVFECDRQRFAVDARAITELVDRPELQASKFGHEYCLGIANRRGVDVPALNLSLTLGLEVDVDLQSKQQLLVLTSTEGYRIGFAYDHLVAIERVRAQDILPIPTYGLREPSLFAGVIGRTNGSQALLLEHVALLDRPQTLNFAKIHQTSPPAAGLGVTDTQRFNQACLVFHAPVQFVVALEQILETLQIPEAFIGLPQPENHLLGQFNLRGEQIPLICLSSLIEGSPQAPGIESRVLLVRGAQRSFGLAVCSTDSIEAFNHSSDRHPEGWRAGESKAASANSRVRSLVSIGNGEQNRWVTLIDLKKVVADLERRALH